VKVLSSVDSLTLEYVYALLIIFAGGVIRGFTGFASGLVMVPLLALLWGPVEAIASVVGLGIFASIQITIPAIPLVSWRDVRPMIVAGLCFTPVGTVLLITLDPEIVKKIIAAAVIFVTVVSLIGWTYKGPRGFIPGFITGAIGGTVSGVAGVGGPPLVLYLMSLPGTAKEHRANIAIITTMMGLTVLVSMLMADAVSKKVLINVAVLVLPYMASVWAGARLFNIIPAQAFRIIIYWMLIAISLMILIS